MKYFSLLTLLSRRKGGGHDRFLFAQLIAPRIPPGRTLGRYPRLCGLLMTTGYSDVKVPKNNPFTCRSRETRIIRFLVKVFLVYLSRFAPAVKSLAVKRPIFAQFR